MRSADGQQQRQSRVPASASTSSTLWQPTVNLGPKQMWPDSPKLSGTHIQDGYGRLEFPRKQESLLPVEILQEY